MRLTRLIGLCTLLALAGSAGPASARLPLENWRGHLAIGFGSVFSDSLAPGGSLSVGAGVDYPLSPKWRVGPSLSIDLLGSSAVTRGSVRAGLDYSLFEAAMLFTYLPARGPVGRLSAGPGLASPHVDLSISAGGAGFTDLTVSELKPELALDVTLMPRHMTVVGVGAELGMRFMQTSQGPWTLLTGRIAVHY